MVNIEIILAWDGLVPCRGERRFNPTDMNEYTLKCVRGSNFILFFVCSLFFQPPPLPGSQCAVEKCTTQLHAAATAVAVLELDMPVPLP